MSSEPMNVLACMPHFYPLTGEKHAIQGSSQDDQVSRAASVEFCVKRVLSMLNREAVLLGTREGGPGTIINGDVALSSNTMSGRLFICTHGDNHLLSDVKASGYDHVRANVPHPMHLGYACRRIFARFKEHFDHFLYIEDDIAPLDPMFIRKHAAFYKRFGTSVVLLPQRYELFGSRAKKVYLDQPTPPAYRIAAEVDGEPRLIVESFEGPVSFDRTTSHGTGCFVITRAHLEAWMTFDDFWRPSAGGPLDPLEQAMVPMRGRYPMYKPAVDNIDYLEVHHVPNRLCHARTPVRKISEELSKTAREMSFSDSQAPVTTVSK